MGWARSSQPSSQETSDVYVSSVTLISEKYDAGSTNGGDGGGGDGGGGGGGGGWDGGTGQAVWQTYLNVLVQASSFHAPGGEFG
jgi:hypothetical protein